jgi:acetyl-CoA carboxylase biotin carboxyl carrier protein
LTRNRDKAQESRGSLFSCFGIGVAKLEIDVNEIRKLVELVGKHHLEELTVEYGDVSVTVKGKASRPAALGGDATPVPNKSAEHSSSAPSAPAIEHEAEEATPVEPAAAVEGNIVDIVAPLVGVFYRAAAPDAPPLVEVGDMIEVGTEVGLIEAMKVFSPIPSEVAGEVVEISGQNGKLVREGEALVRVRAAEE